MSKPITVSEMIEELRRLPPDAPVLAMTAAGLRPARAHALTTFAANNEVHILGQLGTMAARSVTRYAEMHEITVRSDLLERMCPSGDTWPARIGVGALSAAYKSLEWVYGCLADEVEAQKTAKHHLRNALREIADAVSWLTR